MNFNTFAARSSVLVLVVASVGCATAPDSMSEGDEVIVVDEMDSALDVQGSVGMRIEREEGGALSLVGMPGWRAVAPGVWESPDAGDTRMVVGEEGHRWLAEKLRGELDTLEARAAASTSDELLEEQIVAKQQELDAAQVAMSSAIAPTTNAVSCNLTLYTGPSSPFTGTAGAAALAEVSCSGGCMYVTITAQACCAGICTPKVAQSNSVCATPWTAGMIRSGYGYGAASVSLSPFNISQTSSSFSCQ
ncbi:hypothetical protein [Polyangium aurulentum]|uniref:hypothetical protein n=1 Tax=Polyangium aurulentum TaxID=2567896 RepID=UPI0010AEA460|nr:hypothetical protein [Polyangium aurulentum]UQA62786.1 hypothetical protein E8A73_020980 [Polyangium aurulentum]